MDIRIFNELKNRGVITNPFLKADSVKDIDDLYAKGYVTCSYAKKVYDDIIKSLNIEEVAVEETTKVEPVIDSTPAPTVKAEETPAPAEDKVEDKEAIIVDEGEEKIEETKEEETVKTKSSKK